MSKQRLLAIPGFLLFMSALILAVPGCGGGQGTNPDGTTKAVAPVNPAPGSLEPEKSIPPGKR